MATKTILVVDPDASILGLLGFVLEEDGYKVIPAQSLDEATSLLAKSNFDLVLTEALDQRGGLDIDPAFLKKLRSVAGTTPIILLSTYASGGGVRPGHFGLAEVIAKPFDIDELRRKVNKVLDKNDGG